MNLLSYILWVPNPEIFPNLDWGIIGNIRWYGLLFAMAFIIGQQIMLYIFRTEKKPERDIETLTIVMVVATIIGARLGHVLFYEPVRFLSNPIEQVLWHGLFMLLTMLIVRGGITSGIERWSKVLMPALLIILLLLMIMLFTMVKLSAIKMSLGS